MITKEEIAKNLAKLIQLDIDAVEAYNQALKNIDIPAIHTSISQFRDDHNRHIEELSLAIRSLGETPPTRSQDLKGFMIEGFTAIRSATGIEGALKAMHTNEELTNKVYKNALEWDVPPDIKALIMKNYSDEQRHIHYIEHILAQHPWDTAAAPHA